VGIAFAKGLVFAIRKPLVGIGSLEAIAYRCRDRSVVLFVVVDAKMGGFYHVAYRWSASRIEQVSPLSIFNRQELPRNLTPGSLILSPDAQGIPADLAARFPAGCTMVSNPVYPSAEYIAHRAVLELAGGTFDAEKRVEPLYLRPGVPGKVRRP